MIKYPEKLNIIFNKLITLHVKPIIVGGFVRDSLLKIDSKDIDIELYGVSSFELLEDILKEFGSVNSVGKSFGVCKLSFDDLDLDFSLPRLDSKVDSGHRGFDVRTNSSLDFKTAANRRDFTINAIGYDVIEKKLLDPYGGIEDLKNRALHVVNTDTFIEDPLRVLRAVQFCARFNLNPSKAFLKISKKMINDSLLNELPKERIFDEIKKLLLKSSTPSIGFKLLKEIGALKYFLELSYLSSQKWSHTLNALDEISRYKSADMKMNLTLMLSLTCSELDRQSSLSFLARLSNEKDLINRVLSICDSALDLNINNYELYTIAQKVTLEEVLIYHLALFPQNKKYYQEIKERAIKLNILDKKLPPLLQGRDLIKLGFKASPEFSTILHKAYEAQKYELFHTYDEALSWLKLRT